MSNYMFFTPLLTALLGFLIAGELPEPAALIGGALVLLGALLFSRPASSAT